MIDIEQAIKDEFTKQWDEMYKKLCVPGDTMTYSTEIRETTDFGKLLHKEGLWSLYTYEDTKSLMYHLCRGYAGMRQENSPVDPENGACSACGSSAPDEIRGLWTLHNFDRVQEGWDGV